MDGVRIVHCADVHLDSGFAGSGLRQDFAVQRAEEIKASFARIVDLVRDEEAHVLLIAGDLFEHDYVRRSTVQFVIDQVAGRIPGVPVFIAPGNHDPVVEGSYYSTMSWPANVTIFGPVWRKVEIPSTSAAVYGWGFDRRHVSERRLAELRVPPSEATGIVLVHGSDDAFPCEERGYLPLSREECLRCGAGYVALGHIHSHRVVAERKGVLAAYPGSPESLTFGQTAAHGAIVGTVGREGNDLRLVPVGRREHCALDVAVDGAATVEEVAARVAGAVGPEDRAAHLYRVTLTGEVDPDLDIAPALVEEKLKGEFHYLDVRDLTRPAFDLEEIARENSLRGRFVSELLDERRNAPEAERAEIDLALRYGLRALGGGR